MRNRYRIEIYDDVKENDLTLYSEQGVDKEHLSEIVFSNLNRFQGNIRAFVFDRKKNAKVVALVLPMENYKK
jgi:hypothetical protein